MKYLLIVLTVIIAGCSPSEADIQAAIAETEAAGPTETVVPTETAAPTNTSTPTSTPTITPSPTPDVRVVLGAPIDFTLVRDDFVDNYYLPRGWSTPHLNSGILGARGREDGKAYIEATGRISGWIIWHDLNDPTKIAPESVRSYVVMYSTTEGPIVAKSPEWDWLSEDDEVIKIDLALGSWNRISIEREMQSNGKARVWYEIEFIYRNIWASVLGWGWESDVTHGYLENLARVMPAKMEAAPLANP